MSDNNPDRRAILLASAGILAFSAPSHAAEPGRTDAQMVRDWPWLERYAADNARVIASGTSTDMVFIGDSNTELWQRLRPDYFPQNRVNRGIGGQTTPQILLRMMADVVALRPRAVHIMAGTNDVAGNTGPMTPDMTVNNLAAMAAIAQAHHIAVIIAMVPPAARFFWRPEVEPIAAIADINARLSALCYAQGYPSIDYFSVLTDGRGGLRGDLSEDGVHPNAAGYALMEARLNDLLARMGMAPQSGVNDAG